MTAASITPRAPRPSGMVGTARATRIALHTVLIVIALFWLVPMVTAL